MVSHAEQMSFARWAGVAYLVNIGTGAYAAMAMMGGASIAGDRANMIAALAYVAVTILLWMLFRPVTRWAADVAALVSLAGCGISIAQSFDLGLARFSPLPLFGVYCLLTGWLIARSNMLPRWLGWGLAIGGFGWLTFLVPTLSKTLFPFNMAPAIVAETILALWLLIAGVRNRAVEADFGGAAKDQPSPIAISVATPHGGAAPFERPAP